jgi:hypothetical protein
MVLLKALLFLELTFTSPSDHFNHGWNPFVARARKLEWNVHTMATGHDVMITNPNELAEILLRIANK